MFLTQNAREGKRGKERSSEGERERERKCKTENSVSEKGNCKVTPDYVI